ncbi:MAG TPA: toll/interleukin-1 receptor domain-containing protein [Rhodanobacteraceae bacterium]|nr:toll/interleukin-1 receptor domain-containing protein [Rhodanobacteraceae bacterium]
MTSEPSTKRTFAYRAFISYSHADKAWGSWLHEALETWRVPSRLIGTQTATGVIPRRLAPIFRDREELASATDLSRTVDEALARSDALIVICSPNSARSRWVNEEVLAFQRMGRGDRIFCLIVGGEPHASDQPGRESEECFCPALRFTLDDQGRPGGTRTEPIAADARARADSKNVAKLKLIAGLLGVGFDVLVQREAHRRHRRMLMITVAAVLGMAITSVLTISAYVARNEARQRQAQTGDALNFMLGDLHDKLEGMGRLDLMESVTDKAMALFATGAPGSLTDQELTQQSRALVQIGQIRLAEARYGPAMDAFQRADQRSTELTTRHPANGRFLFDRAQAEYWIGNVYWQQRKLTEANAWWTRYRDSALALLEIDPHNRNWQLETTYGNHNLAVLALERDDLDGAQRGFEAELAVKEQLAQAQPDDAELASYIADTMSWLGIVADRRGDLVGAQRLFGEQVRRYARLRALHPEDFRWLFEWANAQELLGASLGTTGRNAETRDALVKAESAYRTLTKHDPSNIQWRVNMASVQVRNASYAFAANRPDEAAKLLSEPMERLQGLGSSTAAQNRQSIPPVLSRGWLLRARIAWHRGDARGARDATGQSLVAARNEAIPGATDDRSVADQGDALLLLGMLQQAQAPDKFPPAWAEAHALLAQRAADSHDWRLLDPWLRLCRLTGNVDDAQIAFERLNASGYVPLQPWPAIDSQPSPVATRGERHVR